MPILKIRIYFLSFITLGFIAPTLVLAQPAGCPSGFIGGNQTVNCSSASTVGSPQSSSTAISTPINVSGTTNDNNTVTITQYTTIQLSGSPVGLASGNAVTNYGTLNSNSFTNGYGISFGANGRSSTGGNTAINYGEIITRGTNANGIYVAPTNAGSSGNTITNIGSVITYGNSAAAISLMSGSTGSSVVNSIINTGALTTSGSGTAYGIEFSSVAGTNTVNNSGTIITSGGAAHAMNITSTRNTVDITNSGTITASGAGANGVNVSGAASITNSGTIGSTSGIAINFGGVLPTGAFNSLIINNGSVINGGIAFNPSSTREALTFNGYSNSSFNNAITGLNAINATNSSSVTMNSSAGYELASGQVAVDATSSLTIDAVLKDQASQVVASSITKTGDGMLTLSGANTYTGGTSLNAGSIAVANNSALGAGDLVMAGGTTLQAASAVTLANNISVLGASTINTNNHDLGLTGNITGTGSVTKSGLGILTLSGANTYSGGTIISAGALVGTTTSLQGSIINNAALSFNQGTSGLYSGVISGTGTLDILGGGVVTLSGVNTYSGQTIIGASSTLALANFSSIANSSLVTNNGTFDIQQKTTNTNLAGNYVQSSTGTLKMGLTTSNVEKLVIAGTASLSGNLYVNAAPGHYNAGRYTLITTAPSGRSGTFMGFTSDFDTALSKYRLTYDGSNVYLLLDSSFTEVDTANTIQSVQINAAGLANIYNQQVAAYQAALTYDCSVYDKNNLCISIGGRYAYAGPSPSANQQAGLVIVGYKPSKNFRIGVFADQSISNRLPSGFSQSNVTPMWGLFAKWYINPDETGLGVQASGVSSSSALNITRTQLSNTEAGSGTAQFAGQGYQLTANYHQPVTDSFSVLPYVGLRYTRVNTSGYTEDSSASVTLPISYSSMTQNTFSVIGGIGFRVGLAENLTGTASIGIQQNLKYSMSNYQATSAIVGLESFSVAMPSNVNSMATATVGLIYEINKRERLGLNVMWQQQPFIATNATTALATYTIGF